MAASLSDRAATTTSSEALKLSAASRLALGTVQFGLPYGVSNTTGQVSVDGAAGILAQARAEGLDTLDTAIAYGQSEVVLGQLGIRGWNVVSKLPAMPQGLCSVEEWVAEQFAQSMQRLGVDQLDGLLLHRPEQVLGPGGDDLWSALERLRGDGRVRKIGISIYGHDELPALIKRRHIDIVQAPLNILDRSLVETGWARRLKEQGVELHVRSTFLQGLLLMGVERPIKFARWQPLWNQWQAWLGEHQLTPLQACLRYSLAVPEVDRVIVGVESSSQLSEIIAAANGAMPEPPEWCILVDEILANPAKWSQL